MQDFKNKLYNYETPPPEEIWNRISEEMPSEKVINIAGHRKSKFVFYAAAAAISLVIIFLGSLFFKNNKNFDSHDNVATRENTISPQKMKDSMILNQKILESIIHSPKEKKEIVSNDLKETNIHTKYLTIEGPDGKPVKISPKVATLIIYADKEFPPRPVWSDKICKWQQIMLSSTVSPTSAGLADLVQDASNNDKLQ
ncbi:MAG: hypothetical protein ABI267_08915 [Ginsengibacter sp.]